MGVVIICIHIHIGVKGRAGYKYYSPIPHSYTLKRCGDLPRYMAPPASIGTIESILALVFNSRMGNQVGEQGDPVRAEITPPSYVSA